MKIEKCIKNMLFIILLAFVSIEVVSCITWSENYTYDLRAIDEEGNYALYNTVSSNTPAHNYEIINVCYENRLNTLKGNVTINYTNKTPYIKIKRTHLVYGDEYDLYVPRGTVLYMNGVGTR